MPPLDMCRADLAATGEVNTGCDYVGSHAVFAGHLQTAAAHPPGSQCFPHPSGTLLLTFMFAWVTPYQDENKSEAERARVHVPNECTIVV